MNHPCPAPSVLSVDAERLARLDAEAARSPRLRAHLLLHTGHHEPVQRIVMAMCAGSYVRPHWHASRGETLIALSGRLQLLTFDAGGRLHARTTLGDTGAAIVEFPAFTCHTLVCLSPMARLVEIKAGPFDPADTHAAAWSPPEGAPEVAAMLQHFARARVGDAAPLASGA